jgi:hypothetical protein
MSDHTVTDHSVYIYLNTQHSVTLISSQLYIMKQTLARHYNLLVQPCCKSLAAGSYTFFCKEISYLPSQNPHLCGFYNVAALLTLFLILKARSCRKYSLP